ncbi:MAG: heavy-metal-associated domain-containing protein [Candidatus Riflebacteria bacterium]|nr:heavy-metal-associated domain-containing protein [Candidatus Riflebacteria bacterium]
MKKTIKVDGMHCNHCKMRVEKALKALTGVTSAVVNLEAKTAEIESSAEIDDLAINTAIDDAGFKVIKD